MEEILGYDCDGREIFEFMILNAIWVNDLGIEKLKKADPREYCAVIANDGNAYAISVNDRDMAKLIRKREHLSEDEEIPRKVKPISEMRHYEIAIWWTVHEHKEPRYYDCDRDELLKDLNEIIKKKEPQRILIKNNHSKKNESSKL